MPVQLENGDLQLHRFEDPQPIFTLVNTRPLNGTTTIGWSVCAPCDQFDRKKGIMIAVGRMNNPRTSVTLNLNDGENIKTAFLRTARTQPELFGANYRNLIGSITNELELQ
jgi:hypothetical protein